MLILQLYIAMCLTFFALAILGAICKGIDSMVGYFQAV